MSVAGIGLAEIVAGAMIVALNAYVLMGGADFGGGVWDLLARGPRREAQRELIAGSLAPIWEANHVWLIVVVVVLFTGFPAAFSELAIVLHIPLAIMLIGIVLRGSAFVFRSYGSRDRATKERRGVTFAVASTITPVVLGMIVGGLASGAVGAASRLVGKASFLEVYVAPWIGAFPIAVGLFALTLFSFLAAVYLAYGATDEALREDFRRRALGAAALVFVVAVVALGIAWFEAPRIAGGVIGSPRSIPLQGLTAVAAVAAIVALRNRSYGVARIAAGAQVSLILWGWVLAQFPFIIPNVLTIRDAAAPRITLELLLIGLAAGAVVLIPSLRYLFRLFGGPTEPNRGL